MNNTFFRWLPLIAIMGSLFLVFALGLDKHISLAALKSHQAFLIAWTTSHYWMSILIFISIYTFAVAISFPGALFLTLMGGFLFGVVWGSIFVVLGATVGASILFFAVRFALEKWVAKAASKWIDQMRQGFQQNAFAYLLTLRLVPIFPFWVVNIVPALLGVEFGTFVLATFLGIIPGSVVYVMVGHGLNQAFAHHQTPNLGIIFSPEILLPLVALGALSLVPVAYKKLISNRKNTASQSQIPCDLAIIGGGAGGLSLASVAAQLGLHVILIESRNMGGDCLNYGCVPSKSLLAAAKSVYGIHQAVQFGVKTALVDVDFQKVMQHVHHVIARLAKHDSVERFSHLGVHVIEGAAEFVDKSTAVVNNTVIKAKRFVVATGSSPWIPPIPGLANTPYLNNETIFSLKDQPQHLIVIGAGPIGCELAQAFSMLGSKVTLIEGFRMLAKDDEDSVNLIREQFNAMGIVLHEHTRVQEVKYTPEKKIKIQIEKGGKTDSISGSHILIAVGRLPNVDNLGLEKAGIQYSKKGIDVNAYLQTSNKKVYALGDVVGHYPLTHMANYHAGVVLRNAVFKIPYKTDYRAVPWVTYTEPEIAHVGILAAEASTRAGLKTIEWSFAENDRAHTEGYTKGKITVITDKKGKILGATIVGAHAGELILPWVVAIREQKKLRTFTDAIVPYPTLSEVSKRVAGEFYKPQLFSKKTRWLAKFLINLG